MLTPKKSDACSGAERLLRGDDGVNDRVSVRRQVLNHLRGE
jgi:hypothetical protein